MATQFHGERWRRTAPSWSPEIFRRIATGVVLTVVLQAFHAQPGRAATSSYSNENSHVVVTAGKPTVLDAETKSVAKDYIRVIGHVRSDPDCRIQNLPKYIVSQQPWHGILCFRDIPGVIGAGRKQCIGKPTTLRSIFYRPKIGFIGKDGFAYEAVYGNKDLDTIGFVDITVTAAPSTPKAEQPSVSESETQQSPIPPCTLDIM